MQEIEAKYRVTDHEQIMGQLCSSGAVLTCKTLQSDTFFDTTDNRLQCQGSGLRIRAITDLSGNTGDTFVITWKGPMDDDAKFKSRQEIEVGIESAEATTAIFKGLGFQPVATVEKERSSYTFMNCRVELDHLPLIGYFVEIEGPDTETIEEVIAVLHLEGESIKIPYVHMVIEHCLAHNIPVN